MITEKVRELLCMARDYSLAHGETELDFPALFVALATKRAACIRLAECLPPLTADRIVETSPRYGFPAPASRELPLSRELRKVLSQALELATERGVPHRRFPGQVSLEHLICALAASPSALACLEPGPAPLPLAQARQILERWLVKNTLAPSLAELSGTLRTLRTTLLSRVYGQDHAVHAVIEGLYNASLAADSDTERTRPLGMFVFAGPPGVGKTFLASLSADALDRPFRTFDMTSYSDHQANNQLIGFAPSFKDAKPGLLTGFVKENPRAILLFDEIEKAHLTTMQLFYQVMDAGRLHDNFLDEDVSFRDTIIIFTTNAGRSLYDNPNSNGIIASNSSLHKGTILNALENERNPANGQPAFPQAICSRLGQGTPVMFNHLGTNELVRIADSALLRIEGVLERQYCKRFSHDRLLPLALVLREGARVDARQLRSEAERYVKTELFKFCSMYEADRVEDVMQELEEIHFGVDVESLEPGSDMANMLYATERPKILLVAEESFARHCRERLNQFDWIVASNDNDAIAQVAAHNPDFVLLDLWLLPSRDLTRTVEYRRKECGKASQVDFTPLNSSTLDLGRAVLMNLHKRFPELPVYLLSLNEGIDGGAANSRTIFQDERSCSVSSPAAGRTHRIDEELFLAAVRAGGARGVLETEFFEESGLLSESEFAEALHSVFLRLHRENTARELARQRQCLEFDTEHHSPDRKHDSLRILAKEFHLGRVLEAEDTGHVMRDVDRPEVKFSDVIGASEAKQSLGFLVDWLRNPKRFAGLGLRPPKGVLLTGPPGTGKTLLARAVAGESNCVFLEESAANFITKWQGSGPENVRALFQRGRKYAPAILFIDEIDAVGKTREGGSNDQARESTLNSLLTEMDGFSAGSGSPVIVLAATNLADRLDPALKRRFDREIVVDLPDRAARLQYLQGAVSKLTKADISEATLEAIANQSARMSVANLERILQEAGVMAALAQTPINDEILLEAFEKTRMGEASPTQNPDVLLRIARHEAGHTLVAWKLGSPVHQVTIVGRGGAGGYMEHKHQEENGIRSRVDLLRDICISMGGRAAELMCYGPDEGLSTGVGASRGIGGGGGDLPSATQRAIEMVRVYGMTEEFGQLAVDELFVQNSQRPLLEGTLKLAESIVSGQLERATALLQQYRDEYDRLVEHLMLHNKLNEQELESLLGSQNEEAVATV